LKPHFYSKLRIVVGLAFIQRSALQIPIELCIIFHLLESSEEEVLRGVTDAVVKKGRVRTIETTAMLYLLAMGEGDCTALNLVLLLLDSIQCYTGTTFGLRLRKGKF
jgi:hypothetical protein